MKNFTYLLLLLFSGSLLYAQDLASENFEGLTIGNVGTDVNGGVGGQNGWFTLATPSGQNSDFQIVNEGGSQGLVMQITGSAAANVAHFAWQNGLDTAWATRTVGNNIIEVEYDFFTGPATTSQSTTGMRLYNAGYSVVIGGYRFVPETKVLTGLAWFDPGPGPNPEGLYFFDLGPANTELVLAPNTWYRVGFAFDKTTGEVTWKGPGYYGFVPGSVAGTDPFEVDFAVVTEDFNTVAPVSKVDGLTIRATAVEGLLAVEEVVDLESTVKLFPNPVRDVMHLSVPGGIQLTKMEILDINGRIVQSAALEGTSNESIDVSALSNGFYLLNVYSLDGKTTKKFIKD